MAKKNITYRPAVSETLEPSMVSTLCTWSWVRSDFADDFAALQQQGMPDERHGEALWDTRSKYVRKHLTLSGREAVCKGFRKLKKLAGFLRLSASGAEALN